MIGFGRGQLGSAAWASGALGRGSGHTPVPRSEAWQKVPGASIEAVQDRGIKAQELEAGGPRPGYGWWAGGGRRRVCPILILLLALQGCAFRHRPEVAPDGDRAGVEGQVGFTLLRDPNAPSPGLPLGQALAPPRPLETPLPEYPRQALAAGTAPVTVVARLVVDEDGAVGEVAPSPLDTTGQDQRREAFWAAIERAVRDRRFQPASVRTFAEGRDIDADGEIDYEVLTETRPVRVYLDVAFRFEVVEGRGRVRIDPDR